MKGSDFAMCQTYPITHAIDTDKSGSLKKNICFFKKKIFVDASSSESVIFPYTLNLEI
jgi:hypothetical protein